MRIFSKHKVLSGVNTRVGVALYLALFLLLLGFIVKEYVPQIKDGIKTYTAKKELRYFDNIKIEAKAVSVYDGSTREEIFGKNATLPLPLASITKVMTALCALDDLEGDGYLVIPPSVLGENGDIELKAGSQWKVTDLVSYMLVRSSNDGAMALQSALGGEESMITCMNKKAEELSLFDTNFTNATGLDIEGQPGAYGSARDAARLLFIAASSYPEVFGNTRYGSYTMLVDGKTKEIANTNKAQGSIVGIQAGKTGLTDLAGGNLVFEINAGLGHPVVIAILGSSEDGRFTDALRLSEAAISHLGATQ